MNKQLIKIILFDIKSNLLSCLLLTFQMIVAFFVIGNLCSITAYKTVTVNALDGFDFPKNCYSPSSTDIYTDGGIVVDYDDIEKERNLSYYIAENYKTEGRSEFYEEKDGTEYTLSVITEHYFDIFGFEVSKGRLFQNTEYGKDLSDNPPVVLGSDFENDYNIGDLHLDKYEVVGILKSGMKTTFLQGDKSSIVSVDDDVFTPVMSIESMKAQGIDYPTSLIYADDKSDLAAINDYAAENGMNTYNFISADETRQLIDLVSAKADISLIVISSIIIILAVFSMIQSTLLYVRKNIVDLNTAIEMQAQAERQLMDNEYSVNSIDVLTLAEESGCSACDCEFVSLAKSLNLKLITGDKKLAQCFPGIAMTAGDFLSLGA